MDWEKTSLKITFLNQEKYDKGFIVRTFHNVIAKPTSQQLDLFIKSLEILTGDQHSKTEVMESDRYTNN